MLLRFMDTDFMSAAGSAAKVPSRIGAEQEAVIGTTSPNGTAINPEDLTEVLPALDATTTAKATDNSLTAYYNAGSAAILLLLLAAVAAIFFCLRAKVRKEMANSPDLGLYEAAGTNTPPGSPKRRRHKEHRRGISTASSTASKHAKRQEEALEMAPLVEANKPEEQQFALGDLDEEDLKTEKEAKASA
jgi:carboxypeptidase D